jgi:hypothetical protein
MFVVDAESRPGNGLLHPRQVSRRPDKQKLDANVVPRLLCECGCDLRRDMRVHMTEKIRKATLDVSAHGAGKSVGGLARIQKRVKVDPAVDFQAGERSDAPVRRISAWPMLDKLPFAVTPGGLCLGPSDDYARCQPSCKMPGLACWRGVPVVRYPTSTAIKTRSVIVEDWRRALSNLPETDDCGGNGEMWLANALEVSSAGERTQCTTS